MNLLYIIITYYTISVFITSTSLYLYITSDVDNCIKYSYPMNMNDWLLGLGILNILLYINKLIIEKKTAIILSIIIYIVMLGYSIIGIRLLSNDSNKECLDTDNPIAITIIINMSILVIYPFILWIDARLL